MIMVAFYFKSTRAFNENKACASLPARVVSSWRSFVLYREACSTYLVHGAEGAVVLLDELARGTVELGVRRRVEHRPPTLHGVGVHYLRLHLKLGEPRHHGHVFGVWLAEHPERARGRELGFRG